METIVELDGKKVRLVSNMHRLRKFETNSCSCFQIYSRMQTKDLPFFVIADFYYYFQDNTAYTQDQLFDIIMKQSFDDRIALFVSAFNGLFPVNSSGTGETEKKP